MFRLWLGLAAFAGFSGVALGAFAAHGLKGKVSAEYLAVFQTGSEYQMIHALALLGVAVLARLLPGPLVNYSGAFFAFGILLFSGSLYLLSLYGLGKFGLITPLGGLCFLAGWACLGLLAWRAA